MLNAFLDIFAYRDNAIRRVDPRAKLIAAFALILAVIASHGVVLPAGVFSLCLAGMLALKLPPRMIFFRLAGPMGIALVLFVLQSFLTGSTPVCSIALSHWQLAATREGIARGMLMSSRVLGAVGVMLLLSTSTPAHEIFHSLRWFRFPRDWVEVATIMYRYTFTLLELADDMVCAQSVRLGYDGLRRSAGTIGTLAGAIIVRSVDQASRAQEAMILRGYKGRMPFGQMPRMRLRDKWIMICILLATAGAYSALELRLW